MVKRELQALGFEDLQAANGKVEFCARPEDIPKANLWLRAADRVLLKMGEFKALTFDELFEGTRAVGVDVAVSVGVGVWVSLMVEVSVIEGVGLEV